MKAIFMAAVAALAAGSTYTTMGQDKNITATWEVVRTITPTGEEAAPGAASFTRGKDTLHYGVELQPRRTSSPSQRGAVVLDFPTQQVGLALGAAVTVELALSGTQSAVGATTIWKVVRITPMTVGELTTYLLQLQLWTTQTDNHWGVLSLSSATPFESLAAGDAVPVTFTLPAPAK